MPKQFEVLDWLNIHFPNVPDFNRDKITAVTDFSLMWNLFESELGHNGMNIQRISQIAQIIADKSSGNNFYNDYYQYFKTRYTIDKKTTNEIFNKLAFRPNDQKDFVATVLKSEDQNAENIIKAILIIIYRFRNNLFHGEKELHNIHTQYENFNWANSFLAEILTINK
ncbi:MAG: hypothetical protein MUO34_06690 [Ignavibacteriaceae bacterium]|nr:hypothetical protein [Ignavibacteriaceae bacterium]